MGLSHVFVYVLDVQCECVRTLGGWFTGSGMTEGVRPCYSDEIISLEDE